MDIKGKKKCHNIFIMFSYGQQGVTALLLTRQQAPAKSEDRKTSQMYYSCIEASLDRRGAFMLDP